MNTPQQQEQLLPAPIVINKQNRRQISIWLREQQYELLEQLFAEKKARWMAGDVFCDYGYNWVCSHDALFDPLVTRTLQDKLTLVNNWAQACPQSYHAHMLLGDLWTDIGAEIRGYGWASTVTEDRWVGARLARDISGIYLLKAIALDNSPGMAYRHLMQTASYLQEPQWLVDLFKGDIPLPYSTPSDPEERAAWEAGIAHLQRYGGELMSFPKQLPAGLPPREPHEFEDGRLYWLHRAIQLNPRDYYTLRIAVYYLYPRWHGDHEQMAAFINGPLCAALSEAERGGLWWEKEWDLLQDYPDVDDVAGIDAQCQLWAALLARPFLPHVRFSVLASYAKFLSYTGRVEESYEQYAEVADLGQTPELSTTYLGSDIMKNLVIDVIRYGFSDTRQVLYRLVMKAAEWNEDSWSLAIAATAHQFGLWGFPQLTTGVDTWIASAVALLKSSTEPDDMGYALPLLMWNGGHLKAAEWLAHQLAQHDEPESMLFLSDMHDNALIPDTPDEMINRSVAEQWQRRSVALGLTRAKLGLVKKFLLADTYVIRDKKKFDEAHQLLLDVLEAGDERARPELFSLLAVSGSKEQRTWAHDTLVPYLLQEEDVTTQRILALNLAFIYENGEGAPISYALARAWKQRARELDEDNNNSPDISRHIVGVLNKFTWSGMRATLHNWLHKEDLRRRIATGQVYAPEGFEP